MSDQTRQDDRERAGGGCRPLLIRFLPAIVVLCAVAWAAAPQLPEFVGRFIRSFDVPDERHLTRDRAGAIAPFFTPEVAHWQDSIVRWAADYNLDPGLVATIIQIESCGDPNALSPAGAQGLMQVMPQHFAAEQDPLDPETNVRRGLDILTECLTSPYNTRQDVGLAFACYNAGPSVFVTAWDYWPQQARDYYIWGTNIYNDAVSGAASSAMLERWLEAGGQSLCLAARQSLSRE